MKTILKILMVLSFFALFSCYKNDNPEILEPTSMSDLVIDSEFDWKTSQDVDIEIISNSNIVVYINSLNEDIYQKAFVLSGNLYKSKISIPTYVSEVNLTSGGKTVKLPISDKSISYSFE